MSTSQFLYFIFLSIKRCFFLVVHRVLLGVFLDNRMLINVFKNLKNQIYTKQWESNT